MINYFLQNPEVWVLIFGIVIGAGIVLLINILFNITERLDNARTRSGMAVVRPRTNTKRKRKRIFRLPM